MEAIERCGEVGVAERGLTAVQRDRFERDGYLVVQDALDPAEVRRSIEAVDRTWLRQREDQPVRGADPLHLLAFLGQEDVFVELLDQPSVLPIVTDVLGWNIFVYHCHLDVHPPVAGPGVGGPGRKWMWHQDGGVQNRDLGNAGPRMSVKVAYFLTDVSEPGRGNFIVVPGSHRGPPIRRPDDGGNDVAGAEPVLVRPGTAVLFDRRLWHMRGENRSAVTRKALFYAYTYRWVRARDDLDVPVARLPLITPVRAQLLGAGTRAIGHWIPEPQDAPLRALHERPETR